MDIDELILLRADYLQLAKGLELQRAAILSIVARLEKQIEKGKSNGKEVITSNHPNESGKDIETTNKTMLQGE